MEENDLISKKDLLQLTKISYGQLYRWKRENLLPEAWFIKKASFTGQETFFPRKKILNRISGILELKDRYSLEELANMISPELTKLTFNAGDLNEAAGLDPEILALFEKALQKDRFNFIELIFISLLGKLKSDLGFSGDKMMEIIDSMDNWLPVLKDTAYRFIVCKKNTENYYLMAKQDARLFYDKNTQELKVYDLDEISKELNMNLKEKIK